MKLLVAAHIYYAFGWEFLLHRLENLKKYECDFIFNITDSRFNKKEIIEYIKTHFNNYIIIEAPNHGRDIGGKLAVLDLGIKLKIASDYTLIVHDKQSIHAPNGLSWRNELFKIIEEQELPFIFSKFENEPQTGLIGSKKFIMNEYDKGEQKFNSSCDQILKNLINEFGLKIQDFNFVAGNIFWIRSEILQNFFTRFSALKIRSSLEPANVLDFHKGTYIHSWERILSWLAPVYGYKIAGV